MISLLLAFHEFCVICKVLRSLPVSHLTLSPQGIIFINFLCLSSMSLCGLKHGANYNLTLPLSFIKGIISYVLSCTLLFLFLLCNISLRPFCISRKGTSSFSSQMINFPLSGYTVQITSFINEHLGCFQDRKSVV